MKIHFAHLRNKHHEIRITPAAFFANFYQTLANIGKLLSLSSKLQIIPRGDRLLIILIRPERKEQSQFTHRGSEQSVMASIIPSGKRFRLSMFMVILVDFFIRNLFKMHNIIKPKIRKDGMTRNGTENALVT